MENGDSAAQEGILYGAEHVFLINDPLLHDYQADLQLAAVTEICKTVSPSIILSALPPVDSILNPFIVIFFELF